MRLAKLSRLPLLIALIGSFYINAYAIEATTNPVGVIQVTALGASDTLISIPLKQPAVFNGVVNSTDGSVLTAEGSPGWGEGDWADTHYAFMRSGTIAGFYAAITANNANTVTLETDDLTELTPGDSFSIHPFWTLDLLFPEGSGVNASSSHVDRDSEIFIPGLGDGINLGAESTYYYYDGAWRMIGGDLGGDFGPTPLAPDSYFVLRNNATASSVVTFTGEVVMGNLGLPIMSLSSSAQDNVIGLQRPIEMTLVDSGLVLDAGDELLVWDHATPQQNRLYSDAVKYSWDGAKWIKDGVDADAGADEVFTPGRGFIIRKASGAEAQVDWINLPNYGN